MKTEYREAFEEIYEIFHLMPNELLNKIPRKFYDMIEEERDTNYFPNIQEPIEKQELKNETIILLGLIYRDFLCSPDERRRLQEEEARELQEMKKTIEKEVRQKYNPDHIFKKKKQPKGGNQNFEETAITVIQEEKWYKKILNLIRGLFPT